MKEENYLMMIYNLNKRLKELSQENRDLREQIVVLKNKRTIFIDTDKDYEIKGSVKVK